MRPAANNPAHPASAFSSRQDLFKDANEKPSGSANQLPPISGEIRLPGFDRPFTAETYQNQTSKRNGIEWTGVGRFMFEGIIPVRATLIGGLWSLVSQLRSLKQFPAIEFLLRRCPALQKIIIQDLPAFNIDDTAKFAEILRVTQGGISKLTLVFTQSDIDKISTYQQKEKARLIAGAFDNLDSLTVHFADPGAIEGIAEVIKTAKVLRTLKIDKIEFAEDESCEKLADALASSISLERISLLGIYTSDNFKSDLLHSLTTPRPLRQLKSLDFFLEDFNPADHLDLIVEFLSKAKSLEKLNLRNIADWITDFPRICQSLIDSSSPLNEIDFCVLDEEISELPLEFLWAIAELARRRTGLRTIYTELSEDSNLYDRTALKLKSKDIIAVGSLADQMAADRLIVIENLLERNRALIEDEKINTYAEKIVKTVTLPEQQDLNIDVARILVRQLLAHSSSVPEFEKVLESIAEAGVLRHEDLTASVALQASLTAVTDSTSVVPDNRN